MIGRSDGQRGGFCLPSSQQAFVALGEDAGLELLLVALVLHLLGVMQRSAQKLVVDDGCLTDATESVLNAAALALDDIGNGMALSASSKSALDRMWSQQRTDGTWDWLEFGLEPWEARNDFGAAIAALVAGSVPAGSTTAQAAGTAPRVDVGIGLDQAGYGSGRRPLEM